MRLIPLAAAVTAMLVSSSALAQFPGYEELARTTALTAADDYRIGKGYLDLATWSLGGGADPDPAIQLKVEGIARRIVAHSDRPDMVLNVVVVPDPSINAAALPGGFLVVNQGLVDSLSARELAFVIAHEISHVQLRHFATTMNMTAALEVLSSGEASHASGDNSGTAAAYDELGKMATRYSRALELEADLYGLLYAMRAGYEGEVGVDAMESMRLLVGEIPDWMAEDASHPTFSQRITELGSGVKTVRETHAKFDAGVAYARSGDYEAAIPAFQEFLTLFPKSSAGWSNLGTCYLHEAIESWPQGRWTDDLPLYVAADITVRGGPDKLMLSRARDAFTRALKIDPNRDAALGNLGVLARLEGDYEGATALLNKARELDPKYAGYMNNLGNVLASQGELGKADRWWTKALRADAGAHYARANRATYLGDKGKDPRSDRAVGAARGRAEVERAGARRARHLGSPGGGQRSGGVEPADPDSGRLDRRHRRRGSQGPARGWFDDQEGQRRPRSDVRRDDRGARSPFVPGQPGRRLLPVHQLVGGRGVSGVRRRRLHQPGDLLAGDQRHLQGRPPGIRRSGAEGCLWDARVDPRRPQRRLRGWRYESVGHSFYLNDRGEVVSISLWSL